MRLGICLFLLLVAARAEAQTAPRVVTFDDVLARVKAGAQPADILNGCDVVFTFSPEQQATLTRAGAPAALVAALQVKRIAVGDVTDFVVILDCSGSMRDEIGPGQTKMDAAKKVVADLFRAVPNGRNLAFVVYGHDLALECRAVKVLRPLGAVTDAARGELASAVAPLQPTGHTPIAAALREAGKLLADGGGLSQVVVITDGLETCHGDPAAEAEKLAATVKGLRAVEVIGVGLKTAEEKDGVAAIARRGRGKFYDAVTAAELKKAVAAATDAPLAAPEKPARKLDAHVLALGETTAGKPAALDLGATGKVTLDKNDSAYVAVKLAADTEYRLTVDVRRDRSTNIQGSVTVLDEDGAEVARNVIRFNEIDHQFRRATRFTVKKAGTYIVRVANASEKAAFWVTVAAVPAAPPAALTADDLANYDPKKPGPVPLPFCGDTLPQLIRTGAEAAGRLDGGGTTYFIAELPKGDYKVVVGLTNARGRKTNLQAYLALLDADGGGQKGFVSFNEIDVTARKSGGFALKEPGVVVLRLQVGEPMQYTLRLRPAGE